MRKFLKVFIFASLLTLLLAACGDDNADAGKKDDEPLKVVASFTIISDMVRQIGGDEIVEVHNLVPTGTDPHEYEYSGDDSKAATDADIFFYNGLNLEGGDDGWFAKLIKSVDQDDDKVYSLTDRVDPMYLTDDVEGEDEDEINPHSFIDPSVGIKMAEDMRDILVEEDPDNEEIYETNANEYIDRLKDIDEDYRTKFGEIPEDRRFLITSERAFQYMADSYDLEEGYIWAIDTDDSATAERITSLVELIKENDVPVLFVETNVEDNSMETVSKESGVEIYGEVYSDEIGMPGDDVDTYVKYLNYNLDAIYGGLKED